MKNPIIYGISLCLLIMTLAVPSYAIDLGGYISSGVESVANEDEDTKMSLNNYLNLGITQIGIPDLSFYGYGRYNVNLQNDESFGDLYLGYLEYRTFQGATDIMLGRFDLMTNRFMTLDGISATQILPIHLGLSVFAGVPRYKDAEELDDEFRMTGALAYGGKIFLSGVDAFQLNVNFYNEEGDDNAEEETVVYRRTAGAAAAFYKNFGSTVDPVALNIEALADQDLENSTLARMSARVAFQYHRFQVALHGDQFDVQDQYTDDRELIIRMISSGEETRYGATASLDLLKWLNIYAGYTMTSVTMNSGLDSDGTIMRAGADLMLMQEFGLIGGLEYYSYGSDIETAAGILASIDWQFARDFGLYLAYENAWITEGSTERKAYSMEGRLSMYLTEALILSALIESGETDNVYVDDLRWGAQVRYAF